MPGQVRGGCAQRGNGFWVAGVGSAFTRHPAGWYVGVVVASTEVVCRLAG
jgi:hypothetical protein